MYKIRAIWSTPAHNVAEYCGEQDVSMSVLKQAVMMVLKSTGFDADVEVTTMPMNTNSPHIWIMGDDGVSNGLGFVIYDTSVPKSTYTGSGAPDYDEHDLPQLTIAYKLTGLKETFNNAVDKIVHKMGGKEYSDVLDL